MSIAEAMLYECAPICFFGSSGAQDLLQNGKNGMLIKEPTNNKSVSISNAIEKLICDSKLRIKYGKQAKSFILKNYKTTEIVKKWKSLIEL